MRTIQTNRVEAEMKYGDVRPYRGATEVLSAFSRRSTPMSRG